MKCARQRQDSKRFMPSFAWQYQNSQAYERNHYSRTFLVIALVKQKISNRLKGWSSLLADILLHYGARSSRAEMLWSSKCDDGTRSAVPVATLKRQLQSLRCLRTTLRFFPQTNPWNCRKGGERIVCEQNRCKSDLLAAVDNLS